MAVYPAAGVPAVKLVGMAQGHVHAATAKSGAITATYRTVTCVSILVNVTYQVFGRVVGQSVIINAGKN